MLDVAGFISYNDTNLTAITLQLRLMRQNMIPQPLSGRSKNKNPIPKFECYYIIARAAIFSFLKQDPITES